MLCFNHIVTNNLNFINIKSNLSIKSEYLPPVACQLMPSHQSDTWLFLCVHFEMQSSAQSIHSVKVTKQSLELKNVPIIVKNCNVSKCFVLFTSLLITWNFINIKSNLSIKSEYLPSCCMSTDAFPSIRHLTVSVCPFWDASISAVHLFCKSNKYHLTEIYSIMVKNCNVRKCFVLFTSLLITWIS